MAEATLKNQNGGDAGKLALAPEVFEAEPNPVLVREVYNAHRTNQRQGTHSTKTRNTISGGGKKPWKQKGTGRARQGSIRTNIWRGGAVIFGPLPRDYSEKVNRKKRRGAFQSMLSSMYAAGEIIIVDKIEISADAKTKEIVALREKIGAKGKVLIVTKDKNEPLVRAAANLEGSSANPTRVEVENAVSITDLLVCDTLVLTREAVAAIEERLK